MGLFSAAAGLLKGGKNVSKTLDMVRDGVDQAFFTKEEASAWFLKYLSTTTGSAKTRRFLAIFAACSFFPFILVGGLLIVLGHPAHVKELQEFLKETGVSGLITTLFAFYFLHGMLRNYMEEKK